MVIARLQENAMSYYGLNNNTANTGHVIVVANKVKANSFVDRSRKILVK